MPVLHPSPEPIELELPANAASVAAARRSAGEYAHDVGAVRHDVELAVSEAVSNSIVHAYPDRTPGTITVRAELSGEQLQVTVADDGTGLRPNLEGHGLGLGLPLIAQVSDSYRIEDGVDGGAVVTMLFNCEELR